MINHISRQSPEFRDFERHGRASPSADLFVTLDKVWPTGDPPDDGRRPDLPPQAEPAVLDHHDRGHRPARARLDVLRVRRLVGADRSRRHLCRDPLADHAVVALVRRSRRPDRPARRRRIRHQEARHDVLHGRAGDLRVPGVDHRRGRFVRAGRASRSPRSVSDPRTVDRARLLDVRLRPAGPAPARLRNRRAGPPGGAPRPFARPTVHQPRLPRRDPGSP